ncbi:hypothetical protein ABIB42_003157 [Massilia sp. UYP32]
MILMRYLFLLAAIPIIISCKKESSSQISQSLTEIDKKTRAGMTQKPIINKYEDKDILELPSIVELNEEERSYLMGLVSSVHRVIDASSNLETEESEILGEGNFFWPKDPQAPVMRSKFYHEKNFRMRGIHINISREDNAKKWNKAWISATPRNFPIGVFSMNLPAQFFDDYVLLRSEQEHRPEYRIKDPLIFVFALKNNRKISMKLEARSDVASVADAYPKSFHLLVLERE